jgi:hypothetical protein
MPGTRGDLDVACDNALEGNELARMDAYSIPIGLPALLMALVLTGAGTATAQLPPNPVEAGETYFSVGLAVYKYNTANFEVGRLYLDDNLSGAGITTTFDRGFLLNFNTNDDRVITPELQLGFAFEEAPFKGALGSKARLHFAAWGNHRSGAQLIQGRVLAPATVLLIQPIDGAHLLLNGDDAQWFHSFPLEDSWMTYDQRFGTGDMMIFFDEPKGPWRFTRGAGLTAGFDGSDWRWQTNSPQMEAFAPGMALARWDYSFDLSTFYIGPRAAFAIGWEPVRQIAFFVSGSFAPMLAVTSINGLELGQCLGTCDINAAASTGTAGWSTLSATDINFAYDARTQLGASIYLWIIRLTAQGGVFVNNQFSMPQEGDDSRYETSLAGQWGYFVQAMATISF